MKRKNISTIPVFITSKICAKTGLNLLRCTFPVSAPSWTLERSEHFTCMNSWVCLGIFSHSAVPSIILFLSSFLVQLFPDYLHTTDFKFILYQSVWSSFKRHKDQNCMTSRVGGWQVLSKSISFYKITTKKTKLNREQRYFSLFFFWGEGGVALYSCTLLQGNIFTCLKKSIKRAYLVIQRKKKISELKHWVLSSYREYIIQWTCFERVIITL